MICLIYFLLSLLSPLSALLFDVSLLKPGHSAYMTKNPDETHEWKIRLIQEANCSLGISAGYCMGEVFEEVLQSLFLKLQKNSEIKVHFMMLQIMNFITEDHLNLLVSIHDLFSGRFNFCMSRSTDLLNQDGKAYFSENHTKLIIADEKYFLLWGTNLIDHLSTSDPNKLKSPESLPSKFLPQASCDMDAIISGPMASKLRKEFFDLYFLYKTNELLDEKLGEFSAIEPFIPIEEVAKAKIAFLKTMKRLSMTFVLTPSLLDRASISTRSAVFMNTSSQMRPKQSISAICFSFLENLFLTP